MKLHFLATGKCPFSCIPCDLAFGRDIQDVFDQLIQTDKGKYAASESLPGKHVNSNVGGSRRPQAGESSARVARTQILVCIYIYIFSNDPVKELELRYLVICQVARTSPKSDDF